MNIYSLRAECMADADKLKKLVNAACAVSELSMKANADGLPDQEIEIRTELIFDEVLSLIRAIPDGHVMLQTLEAVPLAENSLERDYDRT
ncbi:MAG: hypothetical protein V4713_03605 [Pseudomonadota bacterium]